jgi:hypothetical protein
MLWEISEGRRVNPPSEIYRPGDLLPYTLRVISRKCALRCFWDSVVGISDRTASLAALGHLSYRNVSRPVAIQ